MQILQVMAFRWRPPPNFPLLVLVIIWLVILVPVAVPNIVQHGIYGPTGYCKSPWTKIGLVSV